jgi:1-acyl-sn-glycerol-3-phosphate acyltransferase
LSKIWSKGILLIAGIRLSVTGLENFDHNNIYVFVSNHSSQFDIPSLQYAIPVPISIVFKKELSKIPLFGWQLKMGPYIMIDRVNVEDALKSIEEAKKRMTEKKLSPLLFAEGTRSKTGEVQPFKRGAFYLASKSVSYNSVSVSGASKFCPKGNLKLRGTICILIRLSRLKILQTGKMKFS